MAAEDGKILDEQNRYVVPKKEIFTVLDNCHSATAHRERDKTEDYNVKKQYSGITQVAAHGELVYIDV